MLSDIVLSFYIGASQTHPSDLRVVQPIRGNDATMHDVTWHGYPFRFEIYYGLRLTYTRPHNPLAALVLDYTHYKVYADTGLSVPQDGKWHGRAIAQTAPLRERVQSLEMTHGLNMLGLTVQQQIAGSLQAGVYAGGGPVIFLPHTESRVDGQAHETAYRYGGAGFQFVAGAQGCAGAHPIFAEAKYSQGAPIVAIAQGSAQTGLHTVHELAGVVFGVCGRRLGSVRETTAM